MTDPKDQAIEKLLTLLESVLRLVKSREASYRSLDDAIEALVRRMDAAAGLRRAGRKAAERQINEQTRGTLHEIVALRRVADAETADAVLPDIEDVRAAVRQMLVDN